MTTPQGGANSRVVMNKHRRRAAKRCNTCGAQCSAYMCGRCARELRELLIGSDRRTVQVGETIKDQPGLVWYIDRLREQANRQSRLGVQVGAQSSNDGYALLVDHRAVDLLARISASLSVWEGVVARLCGPVVVKQDDSGVVVPMKRFESVERRRALFLANNVKKIRLRCSSAHRLHTDMLSFAKQAYTVINRPPDNFCGPCPTELPDDPRTGRLAGPCATLLYVEENETVVRCERCRSEHDIETLRAAIREEARDKLFTGPELRRLMETRLNDRIPEPTFRKFCRDGRLIPRGYNSDDEGLFTYADVCEAREKPVPKKRLRQ